MRPDVFREQMAALCEHRSFDEDFVLPDYKGLSGKNILPQTGEVFNVSPLGSNSFP